MKKFYKRSVKSLLFISLFFFSYPKSQAQIGASLNFGGLYDYVQAPSISFGNNWTTEAWVYPTNTGGGWWAIMGQDYWNNAQGFAVAIYNGSVFVNSPQNVFIWAPIPVNAWTHIAVTYNNGIYALYKNGNLAGTQAVSFANATGQTFVIGGRHNNNNVGLVNSFDGNIDEVRVWSVTRSECDIQSYMNCEIPTTATGLVANYHFNEGIANGTNALLPLYDATGGTYNGTLQGGLGVAISGSLSNWTTPGGVVSNYTIATAASTSDITIQGNSTTIADGDITPSTSDYTNFNSAATRTFVIFNTGTQTLNVTTPVFTGPNASEFTVTVPPATLVAASTGSTYFVVAFTPTSLGVKTATLNTYNLDCTKSYYKFAITATAVTGAALNFAGGNNYVETNANLAELAQADFSMEAWIRTTGTSEGIITYANSNTTWEQGEKCFYLDPAGKPSFVGYGNNYITGNIAVNDGLWHHIAVVWDNTVGSAGIGHLYVDGVDQTNSVSYTGNNVNTLVSGSFKIGQNNNNEAPNNFSGDMDEVRIWNRVLCLPEIINNMNCELPSPTTQSGLTGYYQFNTGIAYGVNPTATIAPYSAVFPNNGVLTNFSLNGGTSSNWTYPGGVTTGSNCSVYVAPEINVTGNSVTIVDYSSSPNTGNYTNFGAVGLGSILSRTFTIQNLGTAALTISSYSLSGANASNFTITTAPASSVIASGSTSIVVSFSASTLGVSNASLNIINNDCDEGTTSFAITATASPAAAALSFDGVNDYVTMADPNFGSGDFTVETWFYQPSSTSGYLITTRSIEGGPSGNWWALAVSTGTAAGSLGLESAVAGIAYTVITTPPGSFSMNTWNHAALVRSGPTISLYVNGILKTSVTESGTRYFNTGYNVLRFGGWPEWNGAWYGGKLDEVRLWTTARTECQIQTYMNCEIPSTTANLAGNFHFNQGADSQANPTITQLNDASASARTGSLVNMALTGTTSNWVAPGGVTSNYTVAATLTSSLAVKGNSLLIPAGSVSTSTTNATDFGTSFSSTFTAGNPGGGFIYINSIQLSGANASDFSVTTQPFPNLGSSSISTFVISFTPSAIGTRSAIVTINSSDCTSPNYSFVIQGSGLAGAALNFDGVDDEVDLPALNFTNTSVSFEGWFYANGTQLTSAGLIFQRGCGSCGVSSGLNICTLDNTRLGYTWADGQYGWTGGPVYPLNTWFHAALVVEPNQATIYLNGIPYVNTATHVSQSFAGTTLLGRDAETCCGNRRFKGSMDEVRMWNRALSQCEILSYMNCEIPSTATGLVSNYHFNEGIAAAVNTTVNSLTNSASGGNGTLYNFSLNGSGSNWIYPGAVVSNYTTANVPSGTLTLSGNSNNVPIGTSTSTNNFTDFSTNTSRTFVIQNPGAGGLHVNSVSITGTNSANFSVTTVPSTLVAGSGSSNFVITFTPSAVGITTAVVNISSSDCTNPTYSFVISASTTPASALNFDGVDDRVTVPSGITLNNQSFTIEFWAKRTGSSQNMILGQGSSANNNQALHIGFRSIPTSSIFTFAFYGNDINYYTTAAVDGNYHHWACVYDNSASVVNRFVYLDGVLVMSDYSSSPLLATGQLIIGDVGYLGNPFQGNLDELRIWNTTRTQCQIQTYMNCEITGSLTGLVANYHFNEGIPSGSNATYTTLINDVSGGPNGTLNNFSLTGSTSNWVVPGQLANGYTVTSAPTASISLTGNSNPIINNSTTASTLNATDFGTTSTRTFVIQNSASTGTLNIAAPIISGAGAAFFSVTVLPSSSLAALASTSFVVAFTPTAIGTNTAMITLMDNTCNTPIFNFEVSATAIPASALNFDGVDDYVQLSDPAFGTSDFTIEMWAKVNSFAGNTYLISTRTFEGGSNGNYFDFGVSSGTGQVYFETANDGTVPYMWVSSTAATIATGIWNHLAAVRSGTVTSLYLNGILTASIIAPGVTNLHSANSTIRFSGSGAGLAELNGSMDEVRIWNYARTQCQIQSYMNAEIPTTSGGLVSNYHFNQGIPSGYNLSVTSLTDAAGSNTGSLSNFSLTGASSNWVSPGGVVSGYTTASVPSASILVSGNSHSIAPGSTSTSTLNFTDFGTVTSRSFVIQNSATGTLNISTPYLTGAGTSVFSVTTLPSPSLTTSATTSFVVAFTPTSTGAQTVMVNVPSNDCSNGTFSFVLTATAVTASALNFDGVDDEVDVPVNAAFDFTAGTVEAWLKVPALNSDNCFLSMRDNSSARWSLHVNQTTNLIKIWNGSSLGTIPASLSPNTWYHVAVVLSSTSTIVYLNGAYSGSTTIGLNSSVTGKPFTIGSTNDIATASQHFNGSMDELRVWSRALCQSEIQNNMNCEVAATGNSLVAIYHLNQGIASGLNTGVTTATDVSGNSNNGTLNSFALSGSSSNWITGAITSGSSCSTFTTPEINVVGNGISILDGALTPSTTNSTDFGSTCSNSVIVKTFTIQNTGTAPLTVSNMSMSGTSASAFSLSALSPASPVATGSLAVFSVSFVPGSAGVKTATVNISNTDCDESSFYFVITGTANAIPTVTASISNSAVCAGASITLSGAGADTYTWSPAVSNGVSFAPATSQIYTLSGTYTLTGCTSTNLATKGVTVNSIPSVTITAANPVVCSGVSATMTASGAGTGGTYTWNPGSANGNSIAPSPGVSTTYTLTGTSTAGCTSTNSAQQLITVNITPTINTTSSNSVICLGMSASFSVGGANTYSWYPGGLSGSAITVSPGVTTSYTVNGYAASGCVSSNSLVLTVTVNALPTVSASASNPSICSTGTTSLIGSGASTYTWTGGVTNNTAFTPTSTTTYTLSGTYTLTGCTSTNLAVQTITVDQVPSVSITVNTTSICAGSAATLNASGAGSGGTYTWNPGNYSGTTFTPSPLSLTSYTVIGTNSTGCTSTNTAVQSITVNALPTVSAAISSSVICVGNSVTVNGSGASTYTWNNGVSNGVAFTPTVSGTYSVTGTSTAGCTSTNAAIAALTVNALPSLSISTTASVLCFGHTATLNASGANTYTWSGGISNNVAFTPSASGTYTLNGTDVNSCTNTAQITLTVNSLPTLSVSSSASVDCQAQSATLTVSGANSYSWSTGALTASIAVTPTASTVYTITGVDGNTCSNTLVYNQSVTPCPGTFTAYAVARNITCKGKKDGGISIIASSSYSNPVYAYIWSDSTLCATHSCDSVKHLQSGTYNLTVTVTYTLNNFFVRTDSLALAPIVLIDLSEQCEVKVYTGISANGDGTNDVLTIENIDQFPGNKVSVFNRWGVEVFHAQGYDNLDKSWPDKSEASKLPANTYFYIIDLGNGSKPIKGWIELMKD